MLRGTHATTADLIRLRGHAHGLVLPNVPAVYRTGSSRSLVLGRGMEYEKSRKYEAGDDVRMIDWRVTARTGTAYTKVFQEDRQKVVHMLVDLTESMRFGTRVVFKSVVAVETAAMLAWAAQAQGDLVSVQGITEYGVVQSKLASTVQALIKQLEMLAKLSKANDVMVPPRRTTLSDVLGALACKFRTGDRVVVLSDFADLNDAGCKALESLSHRQSLVLCWIQDLTEQQALPIGRYPITDGAQYSVMHLNSRARQRKLQKLLTDRNREIETTLARFRATQVKLTSGADIGRSLRRAFHRGTGFNRRNVRAPGG